jgi:hypothetical protein
MRKLITIMAIVFALIGILFLSITLNARGSNMFVISFVSIGAGIDRNTQKKFESFLSTKYPDISYKVIPAGYEGEGDYCFDLSDLAEEQQATFREELKQLLQQSKLVIISEQENCPKGIR